MDNVKIISFIGLEYEDIPYYAAQSISEKNNNVLVIDNSSENNLFLSLKRIDEDSDSVEYGRMVFLRNRKYSENNFKKFDAVIVYHGLNIDEEMLSYSDKVVFVTNYLPSDMRKILKYINTEALNDFESGVTSIVFRDKTSGKIAEKYIRDFYGISEMEDETIISIDENDQAMRVNFQYNGIQPVKGLSNEMRAYIKRYPAMFRDRRDLENGKAMETAGERKGMRPVKSSKAGKKSTDGKKKGGFFG